MYAAKNQRSSRYKKNHHRNNKADGQSKKDAELEIVMTAIHEFFQINQEEESATKSDLCEFVRSKNSHFTISKFRLVLNEALRLKLVIMIQLPKNTQNQKRNSAVVEIKLPESGSVNEFHGGIPDKVKVDNVWDEICEIENISEIRSSQQQNEFNVKDVKCFYCSRLFYNSRGLKQHCMQSHYKAFGYSFKCGQCQRVFRSEETMQDHAISYHKK